MDVEAIAPGLWRWTTPHPDWTPEQGGPDGWEAAVGSVYYEAPAAVVLIDPLVPAETEERERFWRALERDVEAVGRPLRAQARELPGRLLDRHLAVDRVQLVEVDAIEAEAAEARLARRTQVLGPPVSDPVSTIVADEPALGGDHEVGRVWVQRFGDLELVDLRAVGVGRV